MKRFTLLLMMCLIFVCIGCKQNMINQKEMLEESTPTENTPIADIPVADPATYNNHVSQKEKVDNNGLVTTDIDMSHNELTITYTNKTERTLSFGNPYNLQLSKDNTWVDISPLPNIVYNDMLLTLESGKSYSNIVNLKKTYGELRTGHYRIIKEMYMDSSC